MKMVKIHNIETGEIIEREMNAEELAQWEKDQVLVATESFARAEATAQRQALLAKLGITEEEAKLLFL